MLSRRAVLVMAFLLGAALFSVAPAQAFTIQPLRYRVTIDPGKTAAVRVTVLNDETTQHRFRASVSGVEQDYQGRPLFVASSDSAEEWVSPNNATFSLKPGEKRDVIFYIKTPPKAEPGSHFLALAIEPSDARSGEVGLSPRSAVLLSLTVSGVVHEAISIDTLAPLSRLSMDGSWLFEATLTNRGTVSAKPEGTLILKDPFGRVISGDSVAFGNSLLPKSVRKITPKVALDHGEFFVPGWYTVALVAHYGLSQSQVQAQTTVWYVPPWSIVALVVCFSGGLFLILLKRHRPKK